MANTKYLTINALTGEETWEEMTDEEQAQWEASQETASPFDGLLSPFSE